MRQENMGKVDKKRKDKLFCLLGRASRMRCSGFKLRPSEVLAGHKENPDNSNYNVSRDCLPEESVDAPAEMFETEEKLCQEWLIPP